MKFTNSPYRFLSIALTLALLALVWLPQQFDSAVSLAPPEIETAAAQPLPYAVPPSTSNDPVHRVVDQMPMWPGCEDEGDYRQRKNCADKRMLAFIYDNIKYPRQAREDSVEGMAVVQFVIEKDGRVNAPKLLRDPGAGTGDEALRVVELMQDRDIYWQAGRHEGRPVRVQFNLPVKFKLED